MRHASGTTEQRVRETKANSQAMSVKQGNHSLIESMGIYLPRKKLSSIAILSRMEKLPRLSRFLLPVEKVTGIRNRNEVSDGEFAYDLAYKAAQSCMGKSVYEPTDIDIVVCCNISKYDEPDFHFSFEPNTSFRLKKDLGFDHAITFDINNACAGMFTGIFVVDQLIRAGVVRRGLVCSGEYITHLTRTAQKVIDGFKDDRLACLTLGDSGAAVLLDSTMSENIGFLDIDLVTLGKYSLLCTAGPAEGSMPGAIMHTKSAALFEVGSDRSAQHILNFLEKNKTSIADVDHVVPHQVSKKFTRELCSKLNQGSQEGALDPSKIIDNLRDNGNTASTTHTLALFQAIYANKIKNDELLLFAIQASGITVGSAVYQCDNLTSRIQSERKPKKTSKYSEREVVRPFIGVPTAKIRAASVLDTHQNTIEKNTITMAVHAAEECLQSCRINRGDIRILIYAGVYKSHALSEPSHASIIAGELGINPEDLDGGGGTFAFDINNGEIGWLNACFVASGILGVDSGKVVLICASESELNMNEDHFGPLNICETGSAVILEPSSSDERGFSSFYFRAFSDYFDSFKSFCHLTENPYMKITRDSEYERKLAHLICRATADYLDLLNLKISDFQYVSLPQVSSDFVHGIGETMGISPEALIDVTKDKNLYTSSIPYAIKNILGRTDSKKGDRVLIIVAGAGIQVGFAIYHL